MGGNPSPSISFVDISDNYPQNASMVKIDFPIVLIFMKRRISKMFKNVLKIFSIIIFSFCLMYATQAEKDPFLIQLDKAKVAIEKKDYESAKSILEKLVPEIVNLEDRETLKIEVYLLVSGVYKELINTELSNKYYGMAKEIIEGENTQEKQGKVDILKLIKDLNDEYVYARENAARELGKTKDPRAIEPLIAVLKDMYQGVRDEAVKALVLIGAPAVEPLLNAIKDKEHYIRMEAARALGEIKDQRAIQPLLLALKDLNGCVQNNAACALAGMGEPAVIPLINALREKNVLFTDKVTKALVMIGTPAYQPLIAALKDKEADFGWRVAYVLRSIKDSVMVELLIEALKDEDPKTRMYAAYALGTTNNSRAVEPLIISLKDKDASIRENAAGALVSIGGPSVAPLAIASKKTDLFPVSLNYSHYISEGEPGSETFLIATLIAYGTKNMAEVFLNCGNGMLEKAARVWLRNNGFEVIFSGFGSSNLKWRSKH